jgi:hypothetical protein
MFHLTSWHKPDQKAIQKTPYGYKRNLCSFPLELTQKPHHQFCYLTIKEKNVMDHFYPSM